MIPDVHEPESLGDYLLQHMNLTPDFGASSLSVKQIRHRPLATAHFAGYAATSHLVSLVAALPVPSDEPGDFWHSAVAGLRHAGDSEITAWRLLHADRSRATWQAQTAFPRRMEERLNRPGEQPPRCRAGRHMPYCCLPGVCRGGPCAEGGRDGSRTTGMSRPSRPRDRSERAARRKNPGARQGTAGRLLPSGRLLQLCRQARRQLIHPTYCTKFMSCVAQEYAYERDCAACQPNPDNCLNGKLHYDAATDACLWSYEAGCVTEQSKG